MRLRYVYEYARCRIQLAAVTDLHRDRYPHRPVAVGVVDDSRGDDGFVRNDDFRTIGIAYHHVTRGHFGQLAAVFFNRDKVAYRYRAVEQDDEAADVVTCGLL